MLRSSNYLAPNAATKCWLGRYFNNKLVLT